MRDCEPLSLPVSTAEDNIKLNSTSSITSCDTAHTAKTTKMPVSKQTKKRPRSKESPATNALPSAGYLLTCDAPTKQYIKSFNDSKSTDKKFIIEDLDPTHLLVKEKAREEILRKVEEWMDAVSMIVVTNATWQTRTSLTHLIFCHSECIFKY